MYRNDAAFKLPCYLEGTDLQFAVTSNRNLVQHVACRCLVLLKASSVDAMYVPIKANGNGASSW